MTKYADKTLTPGDYGTVRIPRHVTLATKLRVYRSYRILNPLPYVIDHLVPLELCGTNSIKNLWPQPKAEAHIKDASENRFYDNVVANRISLHDAQMYFIKSWTR